MKMMATKRKRRKIKQTKGESSMYGTVQYFIMLLIMIRKEVKI